MTSLAVFVLCSPTSCLDKYITGKAYVDSNVVRVPVKLMTFALWKSAGSDKSTADPKWCRRSIYGSIDQIGFSVVRTLWSTVAGTLGFIQVLCYRIYIFNPGWVKASAARMAGSRMGNK